MSKAERTFDLWKGLRSLFKLNQDRNRRNEQRHVDPALVTFARLGLLAYYR